MPRLRDALGGACPQLFVKRDDAIPFGFGGNKVRKLQFVAADAVASRADTLVTVGGIQSNHARVTAATAARLGLDCLLIANGTKPGRATANALLDELLGASVEYIASREDRERASAAALNRLANAGRRPYWVPLGASTPLGALGFVQAVGEMVDQGMAPDVIVHASSSGGTQAGLVAGCALFGLETRVIGISADDPAPAITAKIRDIIGGLGTYLGVSVDKPVVIVDDTHVGTGYGIPTDASREAQRLAARTEALFVDHTYTAKALGALIQSIRNGRFTADERVLFWHTGGQVGLFA
jgi:1-aminocyclopropane-1-carboxylate deaminase/D-cysteine desulfhydrase-like pyridoxal-dependent ACC family enzyme